ncbi:hypothetical protein D3C71_525090 [compost metagenome]|jgi:hypothetical protein
MFQGSRTDHMIGATAQQALVFLLYCHIYGRKIESTPENNNNKRERLYELRIERDV